MRQRFKGLCAIGSSFFLTVVFLWPLRLVSPIADDLHLVAQGSGLLRTRGLLYVIGKWSDFSLSSSHLTPFGGIWTAVYVWVANQIALRTPMTLTSSWGLLRVLVIALAIQSTLHFARTLSISISLPKSFHYIFLLVALGSLQVHGYWSNDPVISFPVASWAVCVIGFLYLSLLIRALNPSIWSSRKYPISAIIIAFVGVLTYELFFAFLISGFCFVVLSILRSRQINRFLLVLSVAGVFTPMSILITSQFMRMSKGSVYGGTEIALTTASLPKIAFVALMSCLPLANLKLTDQLVQHGRVVVSQLLISSGVLLFICGSLVRRTAKKSEPVHYRYVIGNVLSISSVWIFSTVLIILTPKYQSELNGVLGKVYTNYAASWLAIALLISILVSLIVGKVPRIAAQLIVLLLLFAGVYQVSANLRQINVLQRDSSWSKSLLSLVESPVHENTSRCDQFNILFSIPFPEYYQNAIYDGIQSAYSGTYGVPYCDFEAADRQSAFTLRSLSGLYPIELLPDGRKFYWTNSELVSFEITYRGESNIKGEIELTISPSPCGSVHQLKIAIDGTELGSGSLSSKAIALRVPIELTTNQKYGVLIHQTGSVCSIESDLRSFMTMLNFPRLILSRT